MSYLPSESWKYQQSLYNSFNNELLSGIQQGLSLYSKDEDIKLYKPLEFKQLDKVNFDDINKKIEENDNIYNNVKATVSGGLNGLLGDAGKNLNTFFGDLLGISESKVQTYLVIGLISIVIFKKL